MKCTAKSQQLGAGTAAGGGALESRQNASDGDWVSSRERWQGGSAAEGGGGGASDAAMDLRASSQVFRALQRACGGMSGTLTPPQVILKPR